NARGKLSSPGGHVVSVHKDLMYLMMLRICSGDAASPKDGMSMDKPYASPPSRTMPVHCSSGSAELVLHSARFAAGTSSFVMAFETPRPSAPWHELHHLP